MNAQEALKQYETWVSGGRAGMLKHEVTDALARALTEAKGGEAGLKLYEYEWYEQVGYGFLHEAGNRDGVDSGIYYLASEVDAVIDGLKRRNLDLAIGAAMYEKQQERDEETISELRALLASQAASPVDQGMREAAINAKYLRITPNLSKRITPAFALPVA